jgi:acetylornithine deacetylase/succinyl-diaminopimelate desuccinylase-like protein
MRCHASSSSTLRAPPIRNATKSSPDRTRTTFRKLGTREQPSNQSRTPAWPHPRAGGIGRDPDGRLTRLAASDADKLGRDRLVAWLQGAGLEVAIDRIGNIFGIWRNGAGADLAPVMIGSHIDTVIDAGIYDGCYGVLSGLEVIETLKSSGFAPARPIAVAAFTNEEGVRYAPDMIGSLVHAGGLAVEAALAAVGTDGTRLGAELARIGYAGAEEPASSRRRPMWSCTSSRGRCWSARA